MPAPLRILAPALFALIALAGACGDEPSATPFFELYIDGTLSGGSPAIDFPDAEPESEGIAAQLELKNLGPGALELTGSPPVRLERDDRLAFRVTQPATTRVSAGDSIFVSVVFAPHSPGSSVARLVIATNAGEEPLVIALSGEAVPDARPVLTAALDGEVGLDAYDFGAVDALATKDVVLRLTNSGTGIFELGESPVRISGTDAAAFAVEDPASTALAAGDAVDITVTFQPPGCRTYRATLVIDPVGPTATRNIELSGRGGDNPQGHGDITDPELLDAPDLDVALSGPVVAGKRRFAVGNLTVGSYAGQVGVYVWDGCTLSREHIISAASAGLTAELFGAQVALSDDGTTLLVTARDQLKDAWLFSIDSDDEPRYLATLATFDEGGGHGRGAALSGDGSVALVGQTDNDSGFNPHGAVFLYERPAAGWQSIPEARFRLVPSATTQVELIGGWVETSTDGEVVVSGSLLTPAGAPIKGPATAYVWSAERDEDSGERVWGKAIGGGEPTDRSETVRLVSAQAPTDGAARVAIAADGDTIAMSTVVSAEVQIRLYVRTTDLWGLPTTSIDERLPTARLTLAGGSALRMALAPAGEFLLLASEVGAREVARPAEGWVSQDALTSIAETWNVPFYGSIALSPDGLAFAGMDKTGAAWFVFR